MARAPTLIPPTPRKTLLEWIEHDDGDTAGLTPPARSRQAQVLHARIACLPHAGAREAAESLLPPRGLALPPLG